MDLLVLIQKTRDQLLSHWVLSISVCIVYFIEKKIPFVPLLGAVLVSTFGGLTLYFKNPIFIYIKPTIINILFAIILLVGRYIFNKNFLKPIY